ncbi:hypothetical protein BC834DRAFT_478813 [Gloeopeniophorella convolvens]|nr:hypothetical protein BC834DRAFT_478813 [Gloeopeniophorella convolvens]
MSSSSSGRGRARGRGARGQGRGRAGAGSNGGRGGGGTPSVDRAGVPRGVCNFYWSSGACDRGFDCTFRHQAKPEVAQSSSGATQEPDDGLPDFFSAEGLAINNGSILNPQFTLTPSEVHNHLKPYLVDNFIVRDAVQIEGLSRIFASINSRNKAWDSNQAQAFLDTIVRGNALLRVGDILRYSPVAVTVGVGSSILSFQKGYFPILEFMSSDLVLKTTMHQNTNAIYTLVERNYDAIHATVRGCMASMVEAGTWGDETPGLPASRRSTLDGVIIFKTLSTVLFQFLARFKSTIKNHPELCDLVDNLSSWYRIWSRGVQASPPTFHDPVTSSNHQVQKLTLDQLEKDVTRLQMIVRREYGKAEVLRRPIGRSGMTAEQRQEALTSQLQRTYDPPGHLRHGGTPRHDNDFSDIRDMRIAPTHEELLSPIPPYLPVFIPDAPHHLPENSMQKHLDIQFRLLREELTASIRQCIAEIHRDLDIMWMPNRIRSKKHLTILEKLLSSKGGAYKTSGINSVFFHLYTGAQLAGVKAERRNFAVGLILDAPPGTPRDKNAKKRADYWEHSKRLQGGSLVALVLVSPGHMKIFLGTILSTGKDVAEHVKANAETIKLKVSFFDAEVELMALRRQPISINASTYAVLVDNSIMYESIRPFLETLKNLEPASIPFSDLISRGGPLSSVPVEVPLYARAPRFKFHLQCLARPGHVIHDLDVTSSVSRAIARRELLHSSDLDPSQADALQVALMREVSLIQGPPGTGKSFTGKEILRVLFASKIRPIVLIAFTNHALDHMLTSILDAKITTNIVRLGSRATDERIAQYSLYNLEQLSGRAGLDRPNRREFAILKKVEEDMTHLMNRIQLPQLALEELERFLDFHYPQYADSFKEPPFWISELFRMTVADEEKNGGWTEVPKNGKSRAAEPEPVESGIYGFWKRGRDIEYIQPRPASSNPSDDVDPRVAFFQGLGFDGPLPPIPAGRRSLEALSNSGGNAWTMSQDERRLLSQAWEEEMRRVAYQANLTEFEVLRERFKDACQAYENVQDETRRRLLSSTDLIACTTTGAAKLVSLLTSVGPKVLMVEEAGQVLEAHILASLVPSVEHLICIGDPRQLRPTLATFALSMDSAKGKEWFKFDRSLMERLSDNGMHMSQINVQRRMRPSISHFIRTILYPDLEDHQVVRNYPEVQGMQKSVFFLTHDNAENGESDSVSKHNMFEVAFIRDLVLYFLKQGPYGGQGDIAVLCAYLGQLQKVRAALRDLKLAVSVDERDEEQLERAGLTGDDEMGFEQIQVARHIRLGTVDTFQGEEAKIVIISLVRNSGSFEEGNASIGFLKSSNRINVALSRAKHGLYILGNASNLRKNETWSKVLDEMENADQLGYAFPIVCPRHPAQTQSISKPDQIPTLAPEGGCLQPCEFRLACGHVCPSVCHPDQDSHRWMRCNQPCVRISCPRSHPCPLLCSDDCGDCKFPVYDVQLPCGHTASPIPCHMLEKLSRVDCKAPVLKRLPGCEHSATMACSRDPATFVCKEVCGGTTTCCSRKCTARCHECQKETRAKVHGRGPGTALQRIHHRSHACQRVLKCQHACDLPCSSEHQCNPKCGRACRQRCAHRKCEKPCWEPCPPCMEPCAWSCPHASCPVVCGSICSRLPCDIPCRRLLACGHECPSVCGEPCEQQACTVCLSDERKADIVDFIMQRKLEEIDASSDDTSERLIRLECGHIFTVETLDGHCNMGEYYEIDPMGAYTGTKVPPVNYQTPPSCPTCRGPITALRYGRITKRAGLDILEQNVASTMSSSLEEVSPGIEGFTTNLPDAKEKAKKIPPSDSPKTIEEFATLLALRRDRFGKESEPLPHGILTQNSMTSIHGVARKESLEWNKIVRDLLKYYKKVAEVARTHGPHVQAYGAALATLYRLELAAIASDPERASDKPEPQAMEAVNRKIGQPPHKADTRFQVEAFFLSLELRYTLAELAQSRIDGLSKVSREEAAVHHAHVWRSFVSFLYESCIRDAQKALAIAEKCSASRLAARAGICILRGNLELFRFEILSERTQLSRDGQLDDKRRRELSARAQQHGTAAGNELRRLETTYMRSRPVTNMSHLQDERTWFAEHCRERGLKFVQEYGALSTHLLTERGYEALSLQERADIVKAFGFSHRGHFYNCENGHTFVITECGGAMENATCPECRAPIGGSNHRLASSNTRAMEFEEIAREQGSLDAPWAWGRGA